MVCSLAARRQRGLDGRERHCYALSGPYFRSGKRFGTDADYFAINCVLGPAACDPTTVIADIVRLAVSEMMIRREKEAAPLEQQVPRKYISERPPWPAWVAWIAHVFTATGLVLAAGMAVAILEGTAESFRLAFFLMLAACLVDATDGSLARRLRVKEFIPGFDGAKLDDIIDFQTFTSLPLLLMWRAEIVPESLSWVLVVALVASAYGFCQIPAKTSDGYFVGFPSYWNIVAFYLYVLKWPGWLSAMLVLLLAGLTFVPSYYLYPSRGAVLSRLSNFLGGVWVVMLLWVLWALPASDPPEDAKLAEQAWQWAMLSLFYPVYYMAVSWTLTIRRWQRKR
jgi:phosphatidylcholine synthase